MRSSFTNASLVNARFVTAGFVNAGFVTDGTAPAAGPGSAAFLRRPDPDKLIRVAFKGA
jgi:hypothetical protein